jgi:phenolic acid decarboxylase
MGCYANNGPKVFEALLHACRSKYATYVNKLVDQSESSKCMRQCTYSYMHCVCVPFAHMTHAFDMRSSRSRRFHAMIIYNHEEFPCTAASMNFD